MPKLISEIKNTALKKMAEEERELHSPGSKKDDIYEAIGQYVNGEKFSFYSLVYTQERLSASLSDLLSHPLYPKEETKEEDLFRYDLKTLERLKNIIENYSDFNPKSLIYKHISKQIEIMKSNPYNNLLKEMKKTRAKFVVTLIQNQPGDFLQVSMIPVVTGSEENKSFWEDTPSGFINLNISNPNVEFRVGEEYYVDFIKATL